MAAWEQFFEAIMAGDAIITVGSRGCLVKAGTEAHHTVIRALTDRAGTVGAAGFQSPLRVAKVTGGVVIAGPLSDLDALVAKANTEQRRVMGRAACDQVTAMAVTARWDADGEEEEQAAKLNAEFVAGTSPIEWIEGFTRWDFEGLVWVLDIPGTYEACLDRIEQSSGGPL